MPQPLGRGAGLSSGPKPAVPQPLGRGTGLPPGPFPRVVMKTKYKTEEAEILNSLFHFPSYQENRISGATVKPPPASSLPFPPIRFFCGQLPPPPAIKIGPKLCQLEKTSENTGNRVEETWVRVGKLECSEDQCL